VILHAFLFKFARVMSQSMLQWTIIRTYSFYSVASDAEVTSVYTQELSDLDVETKSLGFSIRLICRRCLKREREV